MSGPIVRSGPSSKYTENWDNIFGSKNDQEEKEKSEAKTKKSGIKSEKKRTPRKKK